MFFDDLVDKRPELYIDGFNKERNWLKNAIVFKIESDLLQESINYWSGRLSSLEHEIDYARTPYRNIFLTLGKSRGYWVLGEYAENEEDRKIYMITIHAFDLATDNYIKHVSKIKMGSDFHPRLSVVLIDEKQRTITSPVLAGFEINEKINPSDFKELRYYDVMSKVIVRILTLLNCTNVKAEKHSPYTPNSRIQRARQRRGKLPLVSYYTLKINLGNGINQSSEVKEKGKYTNRIHICRGHFKRYTEEKPLFGKYIGLWWWQPLVRGKNKKGIIYKDYELQEAAVR